jgi:hypothetical protein
MAGESEKRKQSRRKSCDGFCFQVQGSSKVVAALKTQAGQHAAAREAETVGYCVAGLCFTSRG